MYTIPEIKLLHGHHGNTDKTGVGCAMDVISYLNGDAVITDHSECVCYVVTPIIIWLNDYCDDTPRQRLLPFLLRALGSRTDDEEIIKRRLNLVVTFANTMAEYAAKSAAQYAAESGLFAAQYAAEYAAKSAQYAEYAAEYAAKSAAQYAAEYAQSAAQYAAKSANEEHLISITLQFLDDALPQLTECGEETIKRIEKLRELSAV